MEITLFWLTDFYQEGTVYSFYLIIFDDNKCICHVTVGWPGLAAYMTIEFGTTGK
jgi:hypothetical protein